MKKNILASWLLLLWLFISTGCQHEEAKAVAPTPEKDYLVSAKLVTELPQAILQAMADNRGFPGIKNNIKNDVQVYQVTYLTTYQGKDIQASGLMCVPKNVTGAMPILSGQHGTTFEQQAAPTNFPATFSGFELFASAGYLTVIPDYIGYGASKDIFHPYYNQQYSASAVIDLIKAAQSYAKKNQLQLNEQLFLVGYSEGGYVTLAAQKEIETNPKHNLTVTASASGAGGYDLVDMLAEVKSGKPYPNPSYLAFILQAFNSANAWNRPLTELFKEPYATEMPKLFNGVASAGAINRALPKEPEKLFNAEFFANLKKEDGELIFKKALVDNSIVTNWVPQSPTKIYQGTADAVVFYQNSKNAYDTFIAAGAKNLEFIPIQGGTHGSSIEPMLMSVIPWFQSLKQTPKE
ncbi:lipase family protein [Adhaeribacter rhizoryzae]|uniref:Prolyl oligopeptidase family serine peptidase n=1 Tax=Adhaeribacter rhizoryzae TaxID=2607907 RepID=A0A5M6DQW3_9BACT|nr:lipase family protein [Adhaeribacter rhizoryzae]KAA5548632.1 prolyl oligopeptidase family serine peptidase [Adhaeribacter rhizoryzae]